ncbi:hypothetical protein HDA35_005160 [Micromonospora purpureochromogenes]|uniref:DUF397 domain-containing protein n=1 Tax=Micromonospora purpureochromogenes TaxID=47872 RepID=A0ABX2RS03_9ACTN|nr:hypothetical protein [Micromonospora purpureochromogenes]
MRLRRGRLQPSVIVAVRDSKDPDGPALTFAPQAWSAFTAAAQIRSLTDQSWLS